GAVAPLHIGMVSAPRGLSAAGQAPMRAMLACWPAAIGLMTKCPFGTDITGARTRGYRYLLYTELPDTGTLARYRQHPAHVKFNDWLIERDCTPLAFDYYLDETTVLQDE